MNIEYWLGFFRWALYIGTALVATGTIGVSIMASQIDKRKEHKIDDLLSGNKQLQDKIDQYQKDVIEKDKKIRELETGQKELKEIAAPRTISAEQRKKLIDLLSFTSDFQIILACRLQDQESLNYAEELAEIFRKGGWHIGPTNKTYLDNIEGDVAIAVTDDNQGEAAGKIAMALSSMGLVCKPEKIRDGSLGSVQSSTIYLIIGSKLKGK